MERKIIAVLGLPGSGKTEIINYLVEKYKWPKVYFGEITFDEMKRRGLEMNQKNEREVREDLRKRFGRTYYAEQVIKKIEKISGDRILVESLYQWEEYQMFRQNFVKEFVTVAVYASPKTRYERLGKRPERPLNEEEAWERDCAQIEVLTQGGPIAMADYIVINEDRKENAFQEIDKIIAKINQ